MGPKVLELESQIARYVGVEHAVGVSSGTDALLLSLMALDVGPGDLVITTPYSFFATAGAVSRLGAVPVFVDIEPDSYNIDPNLLRTWLVENADQVSKVRAIIPVHLYGQCADMAAIASIAEEYSIPIVEDAAQSIGSQYDLDGDLCPAGSIGSIGCFSFFPSKNLGAMGDGGMVVTKDEDLAEKLRRLRNHGSHPKYYHEMVGGNFRLDALQAGILLAKLPHLEKWHQARRANAEFYDERFSNLRQVRTPVITQSRGYHIYNQYVLRVSQRDDLRTELARKDIGTEVYYPVPFHQQECFRQLGYSNGAFPEAERASQDTLAIPVYPELTDEMRNYVVSSIHEFYE